MSASRRRNVSRTTPVRSREPEELEPLEEEMDTLEPLDEDEDELVPLEEVEDDEELVPLEEVDDSPVSITRTAATEAGFDVCLDVDVPEMEKADVPDAVRGPLGRAAGAADAGLRWQRVAVRFTGAAMIPSAIKELVAEVVGAASPALVVVRRGYGDEKVHEATPPELGCSVEEVEGVVRVSVDGSSASADDVPALLADRLAEVLGGAAVSGQPVEFAFHGVEIGAETHALLEERVAEAGAKACRLGDGTVLFDAELASRVGVEAEGDDAVRVDVRLSGDPAETCAALDLVLGRRLDELRGKRVTVRFEGGSGPGDAERKRLVELLGKAGPSAFAVQIGDGEPDVMLPRLLRVATKADQALVGIKLAGRTRGAVFLAWKRELGGVRGELGGKRVTIDVPEGFTVDAEAERVLISETLATLEPRTVAMRIAGEGNEPFWPVPLQFESEGEVVVGRLETGASKPVDLVRAIERRLPAAAGSLAGKAVRLEVVGEAAMSRTMQRTLVEGIEGAGAIALEIVDHGVADRILPRALRIAGSDGAWTIECARGGRDDEQFSLALQRELDAADLGDGAHVTVSGDSGLDTLVEALVGRGAAVVEQAGDPPVRLHPAFFELTRDGDSVVLQVSAEDAASVGDAIGGEVDVVLGRLGALESTDLTIIWPGAEEPLEGPAAVACSRFIAAGARTVTIDSGRGQPVQHHPIPARELVEVLGRKDDASPPMILLGVDQGHGLPGGTALHQEHVLQDLAARQGDLMGRRILLVERDQGQDRAFDATGGLGSVVVKLLQPWAGAVLVGRSGTRRTPPHFEVLITSIAGLPTGARVKDPRPSAR